MDITTNNKDLIQVCAEVLSSVEDKRRAGIDKLRKQGYKMAMTNNGYVDRVKNTLSITNSDWGYCDGDLSVGDKCALLKSGDFDRSIDIEITAINQLPWRNNKEYSFKYI